MRPCHGTIRTEDAEVVAIGVGGIVRDILSMGARPIALMDLLYFGMPVQQKNLYFFEHVVEGIAGYGNCIGMAQGMKIRMVAAG